MISDDKAFRLAGAPRKNFSPSRFTFARLMLMFIISWLFEAANAHRMIFACFSFSQVSLICFRDELILSFYWQLLYRYTFQLAATRLAAFLAHSYHFSRRASFTARQDRRKSAD